MSTPYDAEWLEYDDDTRPPSDWPEKCASCGASWKHLGFDYADDGFCCRACGRCDSDE